jgi:DNA-binding transcriptional LysR family regulator
MLDVRRLRVLAEVARAGSFAGAAAELGYTPAAVSQQIAALEREAGVRLFTRHARGAEPTQAGRVLLGHAEIVLAQLAVAEDDLDAHRDARDGTVRVAAFPAAWKTLVPHAVNLLRERRPELRVALENAEPEDSVPALRRGDVDVAVGYEPNEAPPAPEDLRRHHLADHRLYVVFPRGHRLAGVPQLSLGDLAAVPWVDAGDHLLHTACAAYGFEPKIVFESSEYTTVQGFVATGAAVALVPVNALAPTADIVVRDVAGAPARSVVALSRSFGPSTTSAFVDALLEAARAVEAEPSTPLAAYG